MFLKKLFSHGGKIVIISASRRTDLPAAHADWLVERFREGFALVRNPMNPRHVSLVSLRREDVDGIVFWTKNPMPLMERLDVFEPYPYYFQYTLTGYGSDVEACLPVHQARIEAFLRMAEKIGPERVLWRYDPILVSERYSADWHVETFGRFAERLRGATEQVTISFVDTYARNRQRLEKLGVKEFAEDGMRRMARKIASIARQNGMEIAACSEPLDLSPESVRPARCVDAELLGRIGGVPLRQGKDANQRAECGCAPSVDIGAYNTCPNGCAYCYANYSLALLKLNLPQCDPESPLLCGMLAENDRVTERKMSSLREEQLKMNI